MYFLRTCIKPEVKDLGFWMCFFLLSLLEKQNFCNDSNNKGGRFQSTGSSMMKHYEKLLEGITVEQLHDHRGLKFPLHYVFSAMGSTAFRQPQ